MQRDRVACAQQLQSQHTAHQSCAQDDDLLVAADQHGSTYPGGVAAGQGDVDRESGTFGEVALRRLPGAFRGGMSSVLYLDAGGEDETRPRVVDD